MAGIPYLGTGIEETAKRMRRRSCCIFGGTTSGKTTALKALLAYSFAKKFYTEVYCYALSMSISRNKYAAMFGMNNCSHNFEEFVPKYVELLDSLSKELEQRNRFIAQNPSLIKALIRILPSEAYTSIVDQTFRILMGLGVTKESPTFKLDRDQYIKMVSLDVIDENMDLLRELHVCNINRCPICYFLNGRRVLVVLDDFSLGSELIMQKQFIKSLTMTRHVELQVVMLAHSAKQIDNDAKLNLSVMIFAREDSLNDILTHPKFSVSADRRNRLIAKFNAMKQANQWSLLVLDKSENLHDTIIEPVNKLFPVFKNGPR